MSGNRYSKTRLRQGKLPRQPRRGTDQREPREGARSGTGAREQALLFDLEAFDGPPEAGRSHQPRAT